MNSIKKKRTKLALAFIFVSLTLLPIIGLAKMRNVNKVLAGTPPFEIIKKILSGNSNNLARVKTADSKFTPYISWLTDPDPRIQPSLILDKPDNNIFTCRNLGAQVEIATGQLDYGINHLHTPILLITVNSDNQAISFFMEGYSNFSPAIKREIDHLNLAIPKKTLKGKLSARLLRNVEADIDYQVNVAMNRYQERIKMGRLHVIGSIVDFENLYKRGKGRLVIININGTTDNEALQRLPILKSISPELRNLSIGRPKQMITDNQKPAHPL